MDGICYTCGEPSNPHPFRHMIERDPNGPFATDKGRIAALEADLAAARVNASNHAADAEKVRRERDDAQRELRAAIYKGIRAAISLLQGSRAQLQVDLDEANARWKRLDQFLQVEGVSIEIHHHNPDFGGANNCVTYRSLVRDIGRSVQADSIDECLRLLEEELDRDKEEDNPNG